MMVFDVFADSEVSKTLFLHFNRLGICRQTDKMCTHLPMVATCFPFFHCSSWFQFRKITIKAQQTTLLTQIGDSRVGVVVLWLGFDGRHVVRCHGVVPGVVRVRLRVGKVGAAGGVGRRGESGRR